MFAKLNLKQRLVSAFLIVALIFLAVAFVGYRGTQELSNYINTLSQTSLPSIEGLGKIERGQTKIESSERLLLVPEILPAQRQAALKTIDQAWSQINDGLNLVEENMLKNEAENNLYQKFMLDWNTWQQAHQKFMQLEQDYDKLGMRNPEKVRSDLLAEGRPNAPEMNRVRSALKLRTQLDETKLKQDSLLQTANDSIFSLRESYQSFTNQIQLAAEQQVNQTKVYLLLCLVIATLVLIFMIAKIPVYLDKQNKNAIQALERLRDHLNQKIEIKERETIEAKQNLNIAQSQLIQSEKMSNLGKIMAGLAHEINNPINFIYGNLTHASNHTEDLLHLLQLYQRQYPHPATQIQRFAEEIDVNFINKDLAQMFSSMKLGAERIRQIISFLRNFSTLEESEMQAVNINEAIDTTLLILNHRLKRGIEVSKNYGKLPPVDCYRSQINLVLMNIIGNAIDALLLPTEKTTKKILIQTEVGEKEKIKIKIRDNGLGISPQLKDQIFEPFFTTKQGVKGVGLGLYICSQIIQKHGGKIEVCSEQGKGTEFSIALPIKQKI
ncbi:ATP-binding protein [Microseira wollei]|uniref:histidine kinase n=1 Tax=Microseira wollei NIES-4236 TaxID=2530354 RepID=A0AAV3WL10_9CYAN|nr:ATP-binding protein [Microseira wollei]GET41469.1 integral membrane sensor signal transduction histidine kinase [Microseira wollei NIES-4236]